MAAKTKTKKAAVTSNNQLRQARFWLMYPPKLITTPIIWEL